jgi:lipoprotein-anchoring transpeptidase ErfK/SrfK
MRNHSLWALFAAASGILLTLTGCQTTTTSRSKGYNVVAYQPRDTSKVRVKVSLQNRMVYVMEGDRPLLVTPTTIGTPSNPTPKGSYRVTRKIAKKRSYTYGFWANGNDIRPGKSSGRPGAGYRYVGYPMAYWVEWMPAYGFHEGAVWPTPRSHGCLRLHRNAAPKFFALVRVGTPVNIALTQPEDATVGKDVKRPADYQDPDPPARFLISEACFAAPTEPLLVAQ